MNSPFRLEPDALRHFPVTAVASDSSALSGWEDRFSKLGQIGEEKFYERKKILHHLAIPGESAEYCAARNKFLTEEMALRRQVESVAALSRALPVGGTAAQEYVFDGDDGPLKLSDLFKPGRDTLAIYSFMYGPEAKLPCTGCTHFLDGLDGMVHAHHPAYQSGGRRQVTAAASSGPGSGAWLARLAPAVHPWQLLRPRLIRRFVGLAGRGAQAAKIQSWRRMGHADAQCVPTAPQSDQAFLGLRIAVRAARAGSGISPQRRARFIVKYARFDAQRTR